MSRIGGRSPSTETNGQSFLRGPGPTRGCRANDDDDDDDDNPFDLLSEVQSFSTTESFASVLAFH
jgi:hypothetical protein